MILLASVGLLNKLNKRNKGLLLGLVCFFLFSCSKSVTTPAATISSKTEYRLKQVDLDGNINYSAVKVL
jgi:outer membrane biogenesis lipoprotein LolB